MLLLLGVKLGVGVLLDSYMGLAPVGRKTRKPNSPTPLNPSDYRPKTPKPESQKNLKPLKP